jgi:beta-lactamase class A
MTVGDLCAAAVELSDNTAANLLLAQVGGPAGLTQFVRLLGNPVTRLDRTEPDLNSALQDDPRDTTSPVAMVDSMEKLLTGNALSAASRAQLASWLACPAIGVLETKPARASAAAYVMEGSAAGDQREQAIAAVGRVIAQFL